MQVLTRVPFLIQDINEIRKLSWMLSFLVCYNEIVYAGFFVSPLSLRRSVRMQLKVIFLDVVVKLPKQIEVYYRDSSVMKNLVLFSHELLFITEVI